MVSSALDVELEIPMGHPCADDRHEFRYLCGTTSVYMGKLRGGCGEGHQTECLRVYNAFVEMIWK